MTRFVIDPAALLAFLEQDRPLPAQHQLVAPNAIRSQALELLLGAVRDGQLSDADVRLLHERLTELKMRLLGDRGSRWAAWCLAREHGWEDLRQAEYLAITRLQADAAAIQASQLKA